LWSTGLLLEHYTWWQLQVAFFIERQGVLLDS
jgi:hypothetical protein